jgi:hypothetical protein
MGGRLTEIFDWLNTPPGDQSMERCKLYGSFRTDDEARTAKNQIWRERKAGGEWKVEND